MMLRLLVIFALLVVIPSVYSQQLPNCSSIAVDADGDGFGWENSSSCRVTSQSSVAPQFINQENGQAVLLTRAYWNATDLYKDIVCKEDYFDGSTYVTLRIEALLDFGQLSTVAPFEGTLSFQNGSRAPVTELPWGIDNGIYTGPTDLGLSPWVEVVDFSYNDGVETQLTRVWTSNRSYTSCRSVNPNDFFKPTGIPLPSDSEFDGSCIDTDPVGDGWGWDGFESCIVAAPVCEDTDGDGWGWDGIISCRV